MKSIELRLHQMYTDSHADCLAPFKTPNPVWAGDFMLIYLGNRKCGCVVAVPCMTLATGAGVCLSAQGSRSGCRCAECFPQ